MCSDGDEVLRCGFQPSQFCSFNLGGGWTGSYSFRWITHTCVCVCVGLMLLLSRLCCLQLSKLLWRWFAREECVMKTCSETLYVTSVTLWTSCSADLRRKVGFLDVGRNSSMHVQFFCLFGLFSLVCFIRTGYKWFKPHALESPIDLIPRACLWPVRSHADTRRTCTFRTERPLCGIEPETALLWGVNAKEYVPYQDIHNLRHYPVSYHNIGIMWIYCISQPYHWS